MAEDRKIQTQEDNALRLLQVSWNRRTLTVQEQTRLQTEKWEPVFGMACNAI